jgi:hypothetical protein
MLDSEHDISKTRFTIVNPPGGPISTNFQKNLEHFYRRFGIGSVRSEGQSGG